MTDNVYWIIKMSINDGKLEALKELAAEMCEATSQEEGALAYEWFLDADEANCHIYERYADSAAAMVHLGNFGAHFAERFMGLVTPTGFELYGAHDEPLRDAVAGLGAHVHGQFAGFIR